MAAASKGVHGTTFVPEGKANDTRMAIPARNIVLLSQPPSYGVNLLLALTARNAV